jgi:hypothetical protein
VNVSKHLSIVALREGLFLANGVQSRGQNRIREIRPSGIVGRLAETWAMGVGLRAMGKPVEHPPNPKAARTALLSRHPHATFCGSRRRVTASGHPVGSGVTRPPTATI